jgi:acetoin utilization protein AcuB
MNTDVISINIDDSIQDALTLINEHDLRTLPVLQEGKLIGVISDTAVKKVKTSELPQVKDIMTKNPPTVPPDFTVEETADLLMKEKIYSIPVEDKWGRILGIISRDDLFRAFISLTGLGKKGIQIAFKVEDQPGAIKKLSDIIRTFGGRIASIMSSSERVAEGSKMVYIRAYNIDRDKLPLMMAELQAQANILYMVDHRDNKRDIYSETVSSYSI